MTHASFRSVPAALTFLLCTLSVATPVAADPESLTLAHTYKTAGTNPDGTTYEGTVTIDILSTTTFAIQWKISGETYKGFGMRRNDTLAATYMLNGQPGLAIYQVQGNGLDGLWSIRGQDGSGIEHLTPVN